VIFDLIGIKRYIEPLKTSMRRCVGVVCGIAADVREIRSMTIQAREVRDIAATNTAQVFTLLTHVQMAQNQLSERMEDLYGAMSDRGDGKGADVGALVDAAISMRDELEHLRMYASVRGDSELSKQMDLLMLVCDKKLTDAGIRKVERDGEAYAQETDIIANVEYIRGIENGTITKTLSGCYMHRGEIVKRASVVVNRADS